MTKNKIMNRALFLVLVVGVALCGAVVDAGDAYLEKMNELKRLVGTDVPKNKELFDTDAWQSRVSLTESAKDLSQKRTRQDYERYATSLESMQENPRRTMRKHIKEGEVIVKYKDSDVDMQTETGLRRVQQHIDDNGLQQKETVEALNIALLKSETEDAYDMIERLEEDDRVEYVEPNFQYELMYTPNDTRFDEQWYLHNTGQTSGDADADIDAPEAWDDENDTSDVVVAVIDTGARYTHEDLAANMWDGSGGCVDDTNVAIGGGCPNHGWDFVNDDNTPEDTDGHGTNIAGAIAAETDNAKGISGISRHNNVKVMALKTDLTTLTVVQAINFARYNGAKVINASFGGYGDSQAIEDAIDVFPGIFVAASGNGGTDGNGDSNDNTPMYPCSNDPSNIICVGATTHNDDLARFSNYGDVSVDIVAPGSFMLLPTITSDTSYGSVHGTSFATPLVAATAALLYGENPTGSVATIKDTLLKSSDHLSDLAGFVGCSRRLNVDGALQAIQSSSIPSESCPEIPLSTTSELVTNGTFELGITGWSYDTSLLAPVASSTAMTGSVHAYVGWVDEYDYLAQDVVLPSDAESIQFSADAIVLDDASYTGGLTSVSIFDADTNELLLASTWSDEEYAATLSADLTAYKGRTISIIASVDDRSSNSPLSDPEMYLLLDNVSVLATVPTTQNLYRFWSNTYKHHFYTTSIVERDSIIANDSTNWTYEGVAGSTLQSGSGGTPIYRFWSSTYNGHFYTASDFERDHLIANDPNWAYEGIAYYAYPTLQTNSVSVHRFWSSTFKGHFYTSSEFEKNSLLANNPSWAYEGIAWYLPE